VDFLFAVCILSAISISADVLFLDSNINFPQLHRMSCSRIEANKLIGQKM